VIRAVRDAPVTSGRGHRPVISIDTTSDAVARAALDAGADWINGTSAGRDAPGMLALAAERAAPIVLMHRRGEPATMQDDPRYEDVVAEVCGFLLDRVGAARAAGVAAERILLDPGIGFGKRRSHNLALLVGLDRLAGLGYPLVLGTSRKRFMGAICAETDPAALVPATCATTALGVAAGVRVLRVHDVAANRQAADTASAILGAARGA
jgi:dihydropteroate synthase